MYFMVVIVQFDAIAKQRANNLNLYEEKILPFFIDLGCSTAAMTELREKIVPQAQGTVLEVGTGSGTNLKFYDPARVSKLYCLEPSRGMRQKAQKNLKHCKVEMEWLELPGEQIPLQDNSVDTVVLTFTLCTIPDWQAALAGMYRVLKPGGKLLFCEHGLAPQPGVQKWQNRINPAWKKMCGGCNLNRPMNELIQSAGFEIESLENLFIDKAPRFVGYVSLGVAGKDLVG